MRVDSDTAFSGHSNMANPSNNTPGLPSEDHTISHWLAHTRNSHHLDRRTTADLPSDADLVIIGSGLSGTALAYFILKSDLEHRPRRVVLLEARQFCHGATSRNGGHCRPDTYLGYPGYKKSFGREEAMKLIDLELETLDLMQSLVETEKIDCDFWRGEGMDVFMSESIRSQGRDALDEYERDGGTIKNHWVDGQGEARKLSRVKEAVAACTYPAGSLFPFKLASGLLDRSLERGLNFQCTTAVTKVEGSARKWQVHTPRGVIKTRQVAYCTNAYTPAILPELKSTIVPIRGHCAAIVPTSSFSGNNMLATTQIIRWGAEQLPPGEEGEFEYLIQRPSDGTIILGGRNDAEFLGNTDDSCVVESSSTALKNYMSEVYDKWGKERPGEGMTAVWTGIMGITPEHLPIVSNIPGKEGCFINAGHNGHGMARIAVCSKGLAKLILAGEKATFEDSGLPLPLQWTDNTVPKDDEWYRSSNRHNTIGQTSSGGPEI